MFKLLSDETSCTVVKVYRRFRVTYYFHYNRLLSETIYLKLEAAQSSETSVRL